MKKIVMAAFAVFVSMGASAQLISSNIVTTHKTKHEIGTNRLSVSYNSLSTGDLAGDSISGISLAWTKGISISSTMPLYIETGVGLTYGFKSKDGFDHKTLGLTVPVNLTYKYEVPNTSFRIAPFVGVYLRGNLMGKTSGVYDYYYDKIHDTYYYHHEVDIDWFDDADDEGFEAKRFSFGWNVGVGFEYNRLYLGVSYGKDFNDLIDMNGVSAKIGTFAATVGVNF